MDWPKQMNDALSYIEEHLSINLDSKEIAKQACCSDYNFQRLFSFLTGLSLAYYIRKRIMSEATKDLLIKKTPILEVSLKYGYDSQSAFSRAYKAIEGVTPKDALKEGNELVSFSPLSFTIKMKGLNNMKFRIEKEEGFILHGISKKFTNKNGENFVEIPEMWMEVESNKELEKLIASTNDQKGLFGVCYNFSNDCTVFHYMIAVLGDSKQYEILSIKPQTYAKFSCLGVKDLQETTKKIFAEWLPESGYIHANSPELEFYPPHDVKAEEWPAEVWIPIEKKA
jgi:AraC family transcriptional regulator